MKFALFNGCKIPYYLKHYAGSSAAVLQAFGVGLVELEFSCCGNPMRNIDMESHVLLAATNLALAEKHGLPILTPCKCCFGSLKHADHHLRQNSGLRDEINKHLAEKGLVWTGSTEIKHLLTVLAEDIGLDAIAARVEKPLTGLKIAASYGCHALRPSRIMQFDNPFAPTIFEKLIAVTGAQSVDWTRRLECCGEPLAEQNPALSEDLKRKKMESAREAGSDFICSACTHCQLQFDEGWNTAQEETSSPPKVRSILFTQLLGLSLGLPEKDLHCTRKELTSASFGFK